jgi:hypothetical protein
MAWLLIFAFQVYVLVAGIRQARRAGTWSWSLFALVMGWAVLETLVVVIPLMYVDPHSRWFVPMLCAVGAIAVFNVVWMILVARRWKFGPGQ